jgi:UDP-N-acetylglucosamine 2-epimerase
MIDNLLYQRAHLEKTNSSKFGFSMYKLAHPRYGVVTLHRPSNVDSAETFSGLARVRGVQCHARYAEAFHAVKMVLGVAPLPGVVPTD